MWGLKWKYSPGSTINSLAGGQARMEGLTKVDIWACDSQSGCRAEDVRTETAWLGEVNVSVRE